MSEKLIKQNEIDIENVKVIIQDLNKNDIANKTSAGFIYQDLVLIKQLLYLENDGTQIGYEVLDDIHKEKKNNLELIQIKSSINDDTLTESSMDFWKTLFNWSKIIEADNIENISFIFYTNRVLSRNSNIFNELIKINPNYETIIKDINSLYEKLDKKEEEKTKGKAENPIFKKIQKFNSLKEEQKIQFFQNFKFIVSTDSIINEIKQRIKFFAVDDKDIDTVYNNLLGVVTTKRYEVAKKDEEFIIDYDYFRKELQFNKILQLARIEEINFDEYYNYENKYDEDFTNNIFYKQLKDIEISQQKINDLARERAKASSFIEELNLLSSDEHILNKILIEEWEEIHEEEYENGVINDEDHRKKAQNCLKKTKKTNIYYKNSNLPKPLTKGKFIDLSDKPELGWRLDWKEKYSE